MGTKDLHVMTQTSRAALEGKITLTRKAARIKLQAAKSASYYMLIGENGCYSKSVSVEEMVRAFESDDRARLRIRLSDSQHTITIENRKGLRSGYHVHF